MALISREQAIAALTGATKETDSGKDKSLLAADKQRVELDGRRQYFSLQAEWSTAIILWITSLLAFNCYLVLVVGAGWLTYSRSPWLVTTFATEIFLQVIGLGYIAARFLFPTAQTARKLQKPGRKKKSYRKARAQNDAKDEQ